MLRVLIVDDCPDAADSLAVLANLWGYEPRVAHCGEQALQEAVSFLPDVILLDIAMPRIDGFDVARRVRDLPGLGTVYLIATSGCDGRGERARASTAGFEHYLVKPVDLDKLKQILDAHACAFAVSALDACKSACVLS